MAGFRIRGDSPIELRAIPHPAVTVAVEFGDRPFDIHGAAGRMRSESLAAGLAFSAFQVRAEGVEWLHHARTWPERFALIDTELFTRLHAGRVVDPEVARAWRQIVAGQG